MTRSSATDVIPQLQKLLGREGVLSDPADLIVYDCDGLTIEKRRPEAVVFPTTTEVTAEVVRLCNRHEIPLVVRGAGTSLAGGCVPIGGGLVVSLTRMRRILEISLRDRMAVVESGVLNLQLARALAGTGFHFAPDPSSQTACTIGGNVATNAGGPHTLKYGVTVNHVLGIEAVLGDGTIVRLGPVFDRAALDLTGVIVGSEGTLAIVTKVWVRLTRDPQDYRTVRVVFESLDDASAAVSDIIAAGIVPAAMELMDRGILAAVDEAYHFGFPTDAEAIAVIELDGLKAGLDEQLTRVAAICRPTSGPCCGSAGRWPSAPSGESARATSSRTALCRAPGCPKLFGRSPGSAPSTAFASSTWRTPATATSTRSCCSTSGTATRSAAPWRPGRSCSSSASPVAGASRRSTGSVSKRSA